eukprot:1159831-Pelagomonas_calceolata.AAC.3
MGFFTILKICMGLYYSLAEPAEQPVECAALAQAQADQAATISSKHHLTPVCVGRGTSVATEPWGISSAAQAKLHADLHPGFPLARPSTPIHHPNLGQTQQQRQPLAPELGPARVRFVKVTNLVYSIAIKIVEHLGCSHCPYKAYKMRLSPRTHMCLNDGWKSRGAQGAPQLAAGKPPRPL